jgi:hypothetical protein
MRMLKVALVAVVAIVIAAVGAVRMYPALIENYPCGSLAAKSLPGDQVSDKRAVGSCCQVAVFSDADKFCTNAAGQVFRRRGSELEGSR